MAASKVKYTPKYFKAQELVSPYVYQRLGDQSLIVMDERTLIALDAVRELVGKPITVNNWHNGGAFDQRGFRDDNSVGAKLSQHRFGRAVDFDVQGMTAEQVRKLIIDSWRYSDALRLITRMEAGTSWVHLDIAPIDNSNGILLFNP